MERLFLFFLKAKPYSIVDINGIIKKLLICLGLSSGALWLIVTDVAEKHSMVYRLCVHFP